MNRDSLDFLKPMFVNNSIDDFFIIVVNQTSPDKLINSNLSNVKVFNSFEKGSPASRNLAIQNATKDICLMADDDIVYHPNLKETILNAYTKHPNSGMISFEMIDENGELHTNYYKEGIHNLKSLKKVFTIVITFNRLIFKDNNVYFNYYFGVGSEFKGETEIVFLRNGFDKGIEMRHINTTIVMHPFEHSGRFMGGDNAIYARSALRQRFYGCLSYLWVFKYVFFLVRHDYITYKEVFKKIKVGFSGIKMYKYLKRTDKIDKLNGC